VISTQAKLAVLARGIAPGVVARISAVVNRFLPKPVTEVVEEKRAA